MKYNKPALSIAQQIDHLVSRGMRFDAPDLAAHHLKHLNYYRLSGYWLRYRQPQDRRRFRASTTFEQVLADYTFDRELKILLLDAIERLEVSVRTRWAHELGLRYGPHAHLDRTLFNDHGNHWNHQLAVAQLAGAVEQSKERFIQHLKNKYDELLPPVWAVVEVMSLGQISRWFANLRHTADRKAIAADYALDEQRLVSFLHHISVVRNLCAHHARFWDRKVAFKVRLPAKNPAALVQSLNHTQADCAYNTLTLLAWLVSRIDPRSHWAARVQAHVLAHPAACAQIQFPPDFARFPVWQRGLHRSVLLQQSKP